MRNSLSDINEYLFQSLDALTDDTLTAEELEREINRSKAVANIAQTVIQNGELAIKAIRTASECGIDVSGQEIPLIGIGTKEK